MEDKTITSIITDQAKNALPQNKYTAALTQSAGFLSKVYKKISYQVEGTTVEQKIDSLTKIFNLSSKQTEALKNYYLHNANTSPAMPSLERRQAYFNQKIDDLNRESRHITNLTLAAVAQFLFINPYKEFTGLVGLSAGLPYLKTAIATGTLGVAGVAYWHMRQAKADLFKGLPVMPEAPVEPKKPTDWVSVVFRNIPILNLFVGWKYARELKQYKKDREAYLQLSKDTYDGETAEQRGITRREKYLYAPTYLIGATSSYGSSEFLLQAKDYVPGLGHAVDLIPSIAAYFAGFANMVGNGYQAYQSYNSHQKSAQERVISSQAAKIQFLERELGLK